MEKSHHRAMWWNERRPEIVEDMEREVYGRVPKDLPKVSWRVTVTDKETSAEIRCSLNS
jgi:hypothetical protein